MAYGQYYQDPYGGYDPYMDDPYTQPFDEETPPPEPNKDWEDVPKMNRRYVRSLNKNIIKKDYIHLKTENLYGVEALVEYIEINEELMFNQETKEKLDDNILTNLKILNLPFSELSLAKTEGKTKTLNSQRSVSRNTGNTNSANSPRTISTNSKKNSQNSGRTDTKSTGKLTTVSSERTTSKGAGKTVTMIESETALPTSYPPMNEYIQTILSHLAKTAAESANDEEEVVEKVGEVEEIDDGGGNMEAASSREPDESDIEEPPKRNKIDVWEGTNVLLMMTGFSMVQKLQMLDIRLAVGWTNTYNTEEEGEVTEVVPLGMAAVRFPQSFYQAVLRQAATQRTFFVPLVGEQGEEIGMVSLQVSLVSLGRAVEIGITESEKVYGEVKFIETLPLETSECIFDPPVDPGLAVTLLNMEPPPGLFKTSSEIIKDCLQSKRVSFEGEGELKLSNYNLGKCRWLEIARELGNSSKLSLSTTSSASSSSRGSFNFLNCSKKRDPELDLEWRKIKRQCVQLWDDMGDLEVKRNSLYEEVDELLRQDKGDGWGSDDLSEKSKKSQERDVISKSSSESRKTKKSSRKTTSDP